MSELTVKTEKTKKQFEAKIVKNIRLSDDMYQLTIKSPDISGKARAGQFVAVLCEDLILRRPFSIANANAENIEIIYKVKGKGTRFLTKLGIGDSLDIIGPLGNGFKILNKPALLVGGGCGVAPLIFLGNILKEKQISFNLLAGFQTSLDLLDLNNSKIITEDGSSGLEGYVNDYLEELIIKNKPEIIYTCGPKPVMEYAVKMAVKYDIEIQTALEREFACGIGACMGCTIQVKDQKSLVNKRICKDGPVFDGRTIIWD